MIAPLRVRCAGRGGTPQTVGVRRPRRPPALLPANLTDGGRGIRSRASGSDHDAAGGNGKPKTPQGEQTYP